MDVRAFFRTAMSPDVYRGIAVSLRPEDHAVVHDQHRPVHERAEHLMDAVTRDGNEPLGQHWSTDHKQGEHFSQQYGGYSKDKTDVVFHATHPEHHEIIHDPGWREEHEVNDMEGEVPVHRGVDMEVKGVSWRPHAAPGTPMRDWTHHAFPEGDEQYHRAG